MTQLMGQKVTPNMKYLLFYSEACSPKIRYFDSKAEAEFWAGQFLLSNQQNTDDNWVDMV